MLTRLRKLLARRRKKSVCGDFRLAVEALESRTVLSAMHLAAQAGLGDPLPADALREPFPADPAASLVQAGAPWLRDEARAVRGPAERHQSETPEAGYVNAVRFAAEPLGPRPFEPADAARPKRDDSAAVAWAASPRPIPDSPNPSGLFAESLPGSLPPPGQRLAPDQDWTLVVMVQTAMPSSSWSPEPSGWLAFGSLQASSFPPDPRDEPPPAPWGDSLSASAPPRNWQPAGALDKDLGTRDDMLAPSRSLAEQARSAREEPGTLILQVRFAAESNATRPFSPDFGSLTPSLDDSLPALSMASQESRSAVAGSLAALATRDVLGAADWDIYPESLLSQFSGAANAAGRNLVAGQEGERTIRSGSPHSDIYDLDAATELVDLLDGLRPSGLESDDEGGVVELDELGAPIRMSLSQQGLRKDSVTADPIRDHDSVDSKERSRLRPFLRDETLDESRLQDVLESQANEDLAEQDRAGGGRADVGDGSPRARGQDEGGTIELAVAAYSTAIWTQQDVSPADDRTIGIAPVHGVGAGSIPMDTGVGLFQAFELAVGPGEPVAQPSAVPLGLNAPGTTPTAAVSAATEGGAAAEQAALGNGKTDLPGNRALVVPSVLVVASLLNDSRRKRVHDDSPGSTHAQAVSTTKPPFGRA